MVTFFSANPNVSRSIGAYNQGLTAETLARIQEATAANEAEMRARAQQAALQSQNQQFQQANALEQQRLQQLGQYQQGQLANENNRYKAMMEQARMDREAHSAESAKDRENRLAIANVTAGARNPGPNPLDIEASNNQAQAMAGRLNFALKTLKENQALEEKRVHDTYKTGMGKFFTPLTTDDDFAKARDEGLNNVGLKYRTEMQRLIQSVPADAPLDFDQNRLEFIPRTIGGKPTASAATAGAAPAAGGFFNQGGVQPTPQMVLQEAADAIAKGANPQMVQERLQSQFGVSLPSIAPTGLPATAWPPVAAPPVANMPPRNVVMPIPGQVAPAPAPIASRYFGGEAFPPQFSDLGQQFVR